MRNVRRCLLLSSALAGGVAFASGCSSSSSTGVNSDGGPEGGNTGDSGKPKPDSGHPKDAGPDGKTGGKDTGTADTSTHDATPDGSTVLTLTAITTPSSFAAIFDAVPGPDGNAVYVTGVDTAGNIGVFSVAVSGTPGSPTKVSAGTGTPWVAPLGIAISSDGGTLYVSDVGALADTSDSGGIYSLSTSAATPTLLAKSTGVYPRGITVVSASGTDSIVFTGTVAGAPGVYSTTPAGSTPTKILAASITDPSGIAADSSGNFYFVDTTTSGGLANVVKCSATGGSPTVVFSGAFVGYPAGIAVDSAGNPVLSSLTGPYGNDVLASISAGAATPFLTDMASLTTLKGLTGAAGLHKASAANVYAFVDSAGLSSDAVYVIK